MKLLFSINYSGVVDLDDYGLKAFSLDEAKIQLLEIGYTELRRISKPWVQIRALKNSNGATLDLIPLPIPNQNNKGSNGRKKLPS